MATYDKRYVLTLTQDMFGQLQEVAETKNISIAALVRMTLAQMLDHEFNKKEQFSKFLLDFSRIEDLGDEESNEIKKRLQEELNSFMGDR